MSIQRRRTGLTLVEVIIAILVFSIGALGLAAGSAVVVRQISLNTFRSRAATIARTRAERASSDGCARMASGEDSRLGVKSVWQVSRGPAMTLDQTLERAAATRTKMDRFVSAVSCE